MNKLNHTPTKNKICIFVKIVVKYYYLIQDRYYDKQQFIFSRNLAYHEITFQLSSSRKRKSSPCDFYDLARETTIHLVNHITPKKSQLTQYDFSPITNFQTT